MIAISYNAAAANASRHFKVNTKDQSKNLEKLSSGYRINRSADDATGLSISEKMRTLIRGLSQATDNCQDGISMLQVADGSLAEMTSMMHRMTELSVKSANGTNSQKDRQILQNEIKQLKLEINGQVEKTKFNDIKIFDPSGMNGVADAFIGTATGTPADDSITNYSFGADGNGISINGTTFPYEDIKNSAGEPMSSLKDGTYKLRYNGVTFPLTIKNVSDRSQLTQLVGAFSVTSEKKEALPARKAVESASFSFDPVAGADIKDGTKFVIKADSDGINGRFKWKDLCPALAEGKDLGANQITISVPIQKGVSFDIKVNNGAKLEQVVDSINNFSATVKAGQIKGIDVTRFFSGYTITGGQLPVNLTSNTSKTFDWSLPGDPANDDALKDIAKKLNCDVTDLTGGDLKIYFQNKNGYNVPTAVLTAKSSKGGQGSVTYTMSKEDSDSLKALLQPGNAFPIKSHVADAKFSYKGSSFVGHLIAIRDVTGTEIPGRGPGILFNSNNIPSKVEFNISHESVLNSNGEVKSMEEGNILPPQYKYNFDTFESESLYDPDYPKNKWWIQSGEGTMNGMMLSVGQVSCNLLGLDDMDISTENGATQGIRQTGKALRTLSKIRSELGAEQNRLEHTVLNNKNAVENTTASESLIRDTDMSTAMVSFHKLNILEMTGESMLAQANKNPEDVLKLLETK